MESLLQSVPRICGPHQDQAITCLRERLALLGRRQQKQPLPIPWGFLCPALRRGTGAQRGQLCPHSPGGTQRSQDSVLGCVLPPPALEARSWTSPQQPPPNVTSLRHMLGL